MNKMKIEEKQFITELKEIVNSSREMAYSAVNYAQVRQNWLIIQMQSLLLKLDIEAKHEVKNTFNFASESTVVEIVETTTFIN